MYVHHCFEEKLRAVELYELGFGSDSVGLALGVPCRQIRHWLRAYKQFGSDGLLKQPYRQRSSIFKSEVVGYVLEKNVSCEAAALKYGVSVSAVGSWVRQVKLHGYESLQVTKPRGRPPKPMGRPKKREPQTELEKLRYENEYLRAENALLKKVKALVEERIARESGKKRKPSKD